MRLIRITLLILVSLSVVSSISFPGVLGGLWKGVKDIGRGAIELIDKFKPTEDQSAVAIKNAESAVENTKAFFSHLQGEHDLERMRIMASVEKTKIYAEQASCEAVSRSNIVKYFSVPLCVAGGVVKIVHAKYQNDLELAKIDADIRKMEIDTERIKAESEMRKQDAEAKARLEIAMEHEQKQRRMEELHSDDIEDQIEYHEYSLKRLNKINTRKQNTINEKDEKLKRLRENHENRMKEQSESLDNEYLESVLRNNQQVLENAKRADSSYKASTEAMVDEDATATRQKKTGKAKTAPAA